MQKKKKTTKKKKKKNKKKKKSGNSLTTTDTNMARVDKIRCVAQRKLSTEVTVADR